MHVNQIFVYHETCKTLLIFYTFLLKKNQFCHLQILHLSRPLSKFIFPFTKREKDIVHGSERLAHGYSIARSPIYSVSTFVLVKNCPRTLLPLPRIRRYFCFTTRFYEGIYAISNTKLVPVLSAVSRRKSCRHDSSAEPTNYRSAILEISASNRHGDGNDHHLQCK